MKRTTIILLLLLLHNISHSQNIKDFNGYVKSLKINYTIPKHFIEADCDNHYRPGNDILLSRFFYELKSINDSMVINFTVLDLTMFNDSITRKIDPRNSYGKNLSFSREAQVKANIKANKIVFFSDKEAKKIFNADNALSFKLRNNVPYKNKYPYCLEVLLHKNDRSDIYIYYWYNDSSKDRIDKVMEETKGILRFED